MKNISKTITLSYNDIKYFLFFWIAIRYFLVSWLSGVINNVLRWHHELSLLFFKEIDRLDGSYLYTSFQELLQIKDFGIRRKL
jgi:hypothetical protein